MCLIRGDTREEEEGRGGETGRKERDEHTKGGGGKEECRWDGVFVMKRKKKR